MVYGAVVKVVEVKKGVPYLLELFVVVKNTDHQFQNFFSESISIFENQEPVYKDLGCHLLALAVHAHVNLLEPVMVDSFSN